MITPPVNSTNNFITVLRMLSVISNRCPDLAQLLLQQNIAFTLSYLLTGSLEVKTEDVELVPRTPQEWFEITCLIEELMPPLPTDGIFSVNSLLERTSNQQETVQWEWRDERQCSHPFSTIDSRIIEVILSLILSDASINKRPREVKSLNIHFRWRFKMAKMRYALPL